MSLQVTVPTSQIPRCPDIWISGGIKRVYFSRKTIDLLPLFQRGLQKTIQGPKKTPDQTCRADVHNNDNNVHTNVRTHQRTYTPTYVHTNVHTH